MDTNTGSNNISVNYPNTTVSNHTNQDLYTDPEWMNQHVGGIYDLKNKDPTYAENQINLINRNDSMLPPSLRDTKSYYNQSSTQPSPVAAQYSRSLKYHQDIQSPIARQFNAVQVQSAQSNKVYSTQDKEPRHDPQEDFLYKRGLLNDRTNRRRFIIHNIDINSKFRVKKQVLITEEVCLLSNNPLKFKHGASEIFVSHKNHKYKEGDNIVLNNVSAEETILRTYDDSDNPAFVIPPSCNVMKVFYSHKLPENNKSTNVLVQFKGIKPDGDSQSSHLGSVPINTINSKHKVHTKLDMSDKYPELPTNFFDYSPDHFFVILPVKMHSTAYSLKEYNFKLLFHSVCSVPLELLNSCQVDSCDTNTNYHTICKTSTNGYIVRLPNYIKINLNSGSSSVVSGGGNCIEVSKVKSVCPGYPHPNKYVISLGQTYHDVVSARLISTEFPNFLQTVISEVNDCLYWNSVETGIKIHKINIPAGNYTAEQLSTVLTQSMSNVLDNCLITATLDGSTNKTLIQSYNKYLLHKPFTEVFPKIYLDPKLDSFNSNTTFTILVNHPSHKLNLGDKVSISGSVSYLGIPADVLNGEHTVVETVSEDSYKIKIPLVNLNNVIREDNSGGVSVQLLVPNLIRLRTDLPKNAATVLGFCTNKEEYLHKLVSDSSYCLTNNSYINMIAKPLVTYNGVSPVKEAFGKIQLGGPVVTTGLKTLYNTFVRTSKFYDDPIRELYELEVEFLTEEGHLVDFRGLDHSYTIELSTVHDIPEGTLVSANTGRNYNINVLISSAWCYRMNPGSACAYECTGALISCLESTLMRLSVDSSQISWDNLIEAADGVLRCLKYNYKKIEK